MKINLKQIEAFLAVAELLNFRRAAERLNTTQPSISSRLSSLETQLNVKLMERDSASVRLTPMGESLVPRAREILHSLEGFVTTAGQDQLFDGLLRLGVTEMIVHSWLGKFLTVFKKQFANIDVDLTVDLSSNLSPALANRNIDLALQNGPFDTDASGNIDLGDFPLVWVCAPSLEFNNNELSFELLARYPVLTHAKDTLPYKQLQAHLSQTKHSIRLVPSTNLAACLHMTLDGLGIACLPEAMVRDKIQTKLLTRLHYPWVPEPLRFSARYDTESAPVYVTKAAYLAGKIAAEFDINR